MHGRTAPWFLLLFLTAAGCGDAPPTAAPRPDEGPPDAASCFDAASCGTVAGQVTWAGDLPDVPDLIGYVPRPEDLFQFDVVRSANPNAPAIDQKSRGVGGAVVFLRGVGPKHARPWDHPPVRVEMRDFQCRVHQGGSAGRVGFVRRGDAVEMVSTQPRFHSLHAGGAAFFTLAFPDADRPRSRPLRDQGVVELTSAANYFWMRAYLFVDDHPYYALTDAEGRFTLPQVPPGRYELACWLPSWREARKELDSESGRVARLAFRPPVETVQVVTVEPGAARAVSFTIGQEMFGR